MLEVESGHSERMRGLAPTWNRSTWSSGYDPIAWPRACAILSPFALWIGCRLPLLFIFRALWGSWMTGPEHAPVQQEVAAKIGGLGGLCDPNDCPLGKPPEGLGKWRMAGVQRVISGGWHRYGLAGGKELQSRGSRGAFSPRPPRKEYPLLCFEKGDDHRSRGGKRASPSEYMIR